MKVDPRRKWLLGVVHTFCKEQDTARISVETFVALLLEAPRTYAELMEITGASFRTAKDRMAKIRETHTVDETWLAHHSGRGALVMSLPANLGEGRTFLTSACPIHRGAVCPHCDGSGRVPLSAKPPLKGSLVDRACEFILSADDDVDVAEFVVDAARFVGWPAPDLAAAIKRVTGHEPAELAKAAR